MALHRCAACGSPNVVTDTQKEGYDYVKGAIGTVVLGVGGAVAGLDGKEKMVYKCPDCGTTLSYCMSEQLRAIIDMGVASEEMRAHLKLDGVPISWASLTHQYRNIGDSQPSAARQMQNDLREAAMVNKAQATKEEFDASVDCIVDTWRKFGYYGRNRGVADYYSPENLYTLEDYIRYNSSVITFIENCSKFIPSNSNLHIEYRGLTPNLSIGSLLREYLLIKYEERTRKYGMCLVGTYEYGQYANCNTDMDRMVKNNLFLTEFVRKYSAAGAIRIPDYNKNLLNAGCYSHILFEDVNSGHGYTHGTCMADIRDVWFSNYFSLFIVENGKLHHNAYRPEYNYGSFCLFDDELQEMIEKYCKAHSISKQEIYDAFAEIDSQMSPIDKRIGALNERNIDINNTEIKQKQAELEPLLKPRLFGKKKAEAEAGIVRSKITALRKEVEKNEEELKQLKKDYTTISLKVHALMNKYDYFMVWEEQ